MQEQNHPCANRAEMCAQLFKCHEKKVYALETHLPPTCLQKQLLAILASLLLTNF